MAALTKLEELLPHLGSVATADDPLAALERGGNALSPALRAKLQTRRTPTPAQRKQWNADAKKAGRLTFSAGRRTSPVARELGAGEFEFSAGIKTSAANEILAGLHASRTWPDVIFLDEVLSAGTREALAGAFQVDRPGGQIGRLQFLTPPTLATVRDGLDRVALNIPFRLNFERILNTAMGQTRSVVTFATGTLRLIVGLTTQTVPISVAARNLEIQIDLSESLEARMDIDPTSPVQRTTPPGPVDGLGVILQNALQQQLAPSLRFTIAAAIPLPLGKLEIRKTAIVTRGDAVLVGVKVLGTPGSGDPATLTALFPNAQTNFFSRVHDSVLRKIVQSAVNSGELTRIAKQTHPDAVITGANIAFGNGTIKVITSGKIVDLCPLGVDVAFELTTTLTITLEGTRIRVKKDTSSDLDNTDAFLCVLTSLGLALLAAIVVIVTNGLGLASGFAAGYALGVVGVLTLLLEFDSEDFDLVLSGGGSGEPTFIELDFPIPGTDLLPTLTGELVKLDESTMLVAARLGTRADVLNTYLYLRFLDADNLGIARAMKLAPVALMDRDSPAPAGDDLTLPNPSTTTTSHQIPAGILVTTKKTHYERTPDELVRSTKTDHAGRIRIYIPKDKLVSKGANKVVETTRTNVDTDVDGTTFTSRTPVAENRPDFYFRVTRPNGTVVNTLSLPAGFFLNFQSSRVGTPANPVTISFGGGPIVVLDPGLL